MLQRDAPARDACDLVFGHNAPPCRSTWRRKAIRDTAGISRVTSKNRLTRIGLLPCAITLSASSPENDTATEEIEIDYGGPEMEIGFNSRYLLDIAQQIEGEDAKISLADSASPTIMSDVSDSSALYVLMPMRV